MTQCQFHCLPGSDCVPMDTGKITLSSQTLSTTRSENRTRRRRREVSVIIHLYFFIHFLLHSSFLLLDCYNLLLASALSFFLTVSPFISPINQCSPSLPLFPPSSSPLRSISVQWRRSTISLLSHPLLHHLQWLQRPNQTPSPILWVCVYHWTAATVPFTMCMHM